jgi:hypothetical protein
MSGAGDREEFGEPFDDAENQGFQVERGIHGRALFYATAKQ